MEYRVFAVLQIAQPMSVNESNPFAVQVALTGLGSGGSTALAFADRTHAVILILSISSPL
jgi:hypothetical protein